MSYEIEHGGRRIPTLAQYCQRVASAHVDSISALGQGWRCDLIRPVLESCSPETLLRFEQADPYIANDTSDIWKRLFLKEFPIAAHQYEVNDIAKPDSWRDELFALRDRERQKFDQLSVRLKASRQEEEERKKESAIKITDKVPPAKRARPWGAPPQPKTLFQKTRSDTFRLQKGIFGPCITRPTFQTRRIVPNTASAKPPPPTISAAQPAGSRVVVRSVPVTQKPQSSKPPQLSSPANVASAVTLDVPSTATARTASSPLAHSSPPDPLWPLPEPRSSPIRGPMKKNPSASLFMPKHRAYSQRPSGVQSKS